MYSRYSGGSEGEPQVTTSNGRRIRGAGNLAPCENANASEFLVIPGISMKRHELNINSSISKHIVFGCFHQVL